MADETTVQRLYLETEAARNLLATYSDILGDDDVAKCDAVEGETNLSDALMRAVARLSELDALRSGISAKISRLKERDARFEAQRDNLRTAICVAMEVAGMSRLETDVATVSRKKVPPGIVIVNEAEIPSEFWKPADPKLDRKALLDALKDRKQVPGAQLSNGAETIQVRFN